MKLNDWILQKPLATVRVYEEVVNDTRYYMGFENKPFGAVWSCYIYGGKHLCLQGAFDEALTREQNQVLLSPHPLPPSGVKSMLCGKKKKSKNQYIYFFFQITVGKLDPHFFERNCFSEKCLYQMRFQISCVSKFFMVAYIIHLLYRKSYPLYYIC